MEPEDVPNEVAKLISIHPHQVKAWENAQGRIQWEISVRYGDGEEAFDAAVGKMQAMHAALVEYFKGGGK